MGIENQLDTSSRTGTPGWSSLLDLYGDANASSTGRMLQTEKNAVGATSVLPELTIESFFVQTGENSNNEPKTPTTTDAVVAEPITETDLKAKYEQVKLTTVEGKQEVRFLEKGHPKNGAFRVIEAAGQRFIASAEKSWASVELVDPAESIASGKPAETLSEGLPRVELSQPESLQTITEESAFRAAVKDMVQQAKEGKAVNFEIDTRVKMKGADGKPIKETQAKILYDELKLAYPEKAFMFSKPDLKPGDAGYAELPAPKVKADGLQISTKENAITLDKELTLANGRKVPAGSKLAVGTTYDGKEFRSADPASKVWAITPEGNYTEVAQAGEGAAATPDRISQESSKRGQVVDMHLKSTNPATGKPYENHIIVRTTKEIAPDGRPLLDAYPSGGESFEAAYKEGAKEGYYAPKAKSAAHLLLPENVTVNAETAYGHSEAVGKEGYYYMDNGFGDAKNTTAKNYTGETDPRSAKEVMRIRTELAMTEPTQVEAGLAKSVRSAVEGKSELQRVSRVAPERGPAPTAEALKGTEVRVGGDGTLQRTETRIGETVSVGRLLEQTEVSGEQLRGLETEVERLKKSDKAAERQRAAELEIAVKTLKGEHGAAARAEAHRAIMETTRTEIASRRLSPGATVGIAVGVGILTSAALAWYLSTRKEEVKPLERSSVGGK